MQVVTAGQAIPGRRRSDQTPRPVIMGFVQSRSPSPRPTATRPPYDRTCFPAPRPAFLSGWIAQADGLALGCRRAGKLSGYGVVRRCRDGCKIGPLFADDAQAAMALYAHLAVFAVGGPLFLDTPQNNPAALALAHHHEMVEVFGCARMYLGPPPDLAHQRIFGVTTFELG